MKRPALWILLIALALVAVLAAPAAAQQKQKPAQTAMKGAIQEVGGFSAGVAKYSDLGNEFAWLLGGRAGITLNRVLWVGAAYYFKADNGVPADFRAGDRSPYLDFEYGGLDLEYIVATDQLFHFTIQALLGYGGYSFHDPEGIIEFENTHFYIFEPGLNAELNVTEWMRFYAGASLRVLLDTDDNADTMDFRIGRQVQEYHYDSGDLSGIALQFGVKFGGFD